MTSEDILGEIRAVLAECFHVPPDTIARATTALDVDGWDSVSHIYVLLEIEKRFGVRIPARRVLKLSNVGDLVDVVAELKGAS